MSSILKALKKLEKEQLQQEKVQSLSREVRLKKEGVKRAKAFWRSPKTAGVLLLLVIFCGAGVLYWQNGSGKVDDAPPLISSISSNTATPDPVSAQQAPQPEILGAPVMEMVKTPEKKALLPKVPDKTEEKKTPSVQKVPPEVSAASDSEVLDESVSEPAVVTAEETVALPENTLSGEAPVISSPPDASSLPFSATEKKEDGALREPDIALLDDPDVKLQAIAWSDDPKNRLAVVNGRILREGDVVEGLLVFRINENEIIFRHGEDLRKLVFRLQ